MMKNKKEALFIILRPINTGQMTIGNRRLGEVTAKRSRELHTSFDKSMQAPPIIFNTKAEKLDEDGKNVS